MRVILRLHHVRPGSASDLHQIGALHRSGYRIEGTTVLTDGVARVVLRGPSGRSDCGQVNVLELIPAPLTPPEPVETLVSEVPATRSTCNLNLFPALALRAWGTLTILTRRKK